MNAIEEQLAGKWKLNILYLLSNGPARWNELTKALPDAAPNVLTRQLRQLTEAGLVSRTIVVSKPPQVIEYALTEQGMSVLPLIHALCKWSRTYQAEAVRKTDISTDAPDFSVCQKVLSNRWLLPILSSLHGSVRFGAIQSALPGLSRGVLAEQLHTLTEMGLLRQVKYPCFPPRVEYNVTEKGLALTSILSAPAEHSRCASKDRNTETAQY